MPGREHHIITKHAVDLLPKWQKDIIALEVDNLINEYCVLPDVYFDIEKGGHEKALPYYFETEGIQFHYPPDTSIVPSYRYWKASKDKQRLERVVKVKNENWEHVSKGFQYYTENSVNALRDSNLKDACAFMGCLLHMLQDAGFGWHSMEGPYGTDLFVLDRLFPETEDISKLSSGILVGSPEINSIEIDKYSLCLLGFTHEEASFHLYTRYVQIVTKARRICFQIVLNKREGKQEANDLLYKQMYENIITLCADVIFTVLSIASNRFDTDISHLMKVTLSDIEPVERPWGLSGSYRFVSVLKDKAFNLQSEYIPLELLLDRDGKKQVVKFEKGLAMGGHYSLSIVYYIPKNIYKNLSCAIGLHSDFYKKGDINVRLLSDNKLVYENRFNKNKGGDEITIDKPEGKLEFAVDTSKGMGGIYNNIVWANPVLERNDETY